MLNRARPLYHIYFRLSTEFSQIFIFHRENFCFLCYSLLISLILAFILCFSAVISAAAIGRSDAGTHRDASRSLPAGLEPGPGGQRSGRPTHAVPWRTGVRRYGSGRRGRSVDFAEVKWIPVLQMEICKTPTILNSQLSILNSNGTGTPSPTDSVPWRTGVRRYGSGRRGRPPLLRWRF